MSTKPIREALERIQCTCRDHSCVGCEAEAAVSAIEQAAKAMHRCDFIHPTSTDVADIEAAAAVFASIAKDAP